jgi:hypothetical protein
MRPGRCRGRRTWLRRCRRRRAPLLLWRRLLGWGPPLRRRAVWARARGRRAVTLRWTDGSAERIETFGRTSLITRWLGRGKRRRWLPPARRGRGCRLLIAAPLLRRRRLLGLRRRRVVCLRRRCAPRGCGRRLGSGWRVVRWGRRRPGRTWCRGSLPRWRRRQRRAARETKFAGGLVAGAAPRADDHEPYSRNLRRPENPGVARGRQHTRFRPKRREIARGCGTDAGSASGRGAAISLGLIRLDPL